MANSFFIQMITFMNDIDIDYIWWWWLAHTIGILHPSSKKIPMMKEEKFNSPKYLYAHNNRLKFAMTIKIHVFD